MSFKLRPGASLKKNLRRILRKQIAAAKEQLSSAAAGEHEVGIHEARKALKKARAVLRLVRPALGHSLWQQANRALRDAARPLSAIRDAKVLTDVVQKLTPKSKNDPLRQTLTSIQARLQENASRVRRDVLDSENTLEAVSQQLKGLEPDIKKWCHVPDKWNSLGKGLRQSYERASRAFTTAAAKPTAENLHEWRKHVKCLQHQLELLRPLSQKRPKALTDKTRKLGELLGDDHDLAVLSQRLTSEPQEYGNSTNLAGILSLIARRQADLRHEALMLGQGFFEPRPTEFVQPLKRA
jgi:CHAD domain-containing protein